MATTDIEPSELTKWDPGLTERVMGIIRPFLKRYFRSEVRGLENLPPGGALLVSNHSGGMLPMDVPDPRRPTSTTSYGYDRPLYTLSHDMLLTGPTGDFFKQDRLHQRQPRERRRGAALRRPGGGVPRRRLRRVPADARRRTRSTSAAAPATSRPRCNAGVPIVPDGRHRRPGDARSS